MIEGIRSVKNDFSRKEEVQQHAKRVTQHNVWVARVTEKSAKESERVYGNYLAYMSAREANAKCLLVLRHKVRVDRCQGRGGGIYVKELPLTPKPPPRTPPRTPQRHLPPKDLPSSRDPGPSLLSNPVRTLALAPTQPATPARPRIAQPNAPPPKPAPVPSATCTSPPAQGVQLPTAPSPPLAASRPSAALPTSRLSSPLTMRAGSTPAPFPTPASRPHHPRSPHPPTRVKPSPRRPPPAPLYRRATTSPPPVLRPPPHRVFVRPMRSPAAPRDTRTHCAWSRTVPGSSYRGPPTPPPPAPSAARVSLSGPPQLSDATPRPPAAPPPTPPLYMYSKQARIIPSHNIEPVHFRSSRS
ncbi:vegetative cell wall protein gp1-like [Penaeus chinensis]|uniref:vegetative cell wall protein gp1-like n=1 Tax=Penaeus chinensis TaxID=139456 RepID=UPI001FB7DBD6|nr:vegetative cell wall protein gp1-like [Penaeus chinensis]